MNMKKLFLLNLPYLLFVYPFDKLAQAFRLAPGADLSGKLLSIGDGFTATLSSPWLSFHPTDLLIGIAGAVVLRMAVYLKGKNAKKYRHGIEYGSARWGTAADIAPYMDKDFFQNIPMTQTERITMASRPKQPKYARNKNILVIGGSGSGKTRFFCKPSLLQAHSSYVCTDPKGTLLPEIGAFLERKKYRIKCLNLINFRKSMKYNPLAYIRSEKDILKLVNALIMNTKGEGEKSSEDFWVKAERLYYSALIGYIWYEATEEEKNFITLLDLINASEAREDDETYQSPVDLLFSQLEEREPDHFAVKQYRKFKMAAGVVCSKRLFNQAVGKSLRTHNLKPKKGAQVMRKNEKITALYERLSRDDFGKDDDQQRESNSISNQKAMLEEFAARQGFTNLVHFTDDGISGTCFQRPSFQNMIKDIESGLINCVITKDLSRLGRNYLDCGLYLEVFFPEHNVRYIAVNDGVDTLNKSAMDITPFRNILNEMYAADISVKIKSAYRARFQQGKFMGTTAPYGYIKDPADHNHLLIDDKVAHVVKEIFDLALKGNGVAKICRHLNKQHILRPAAYAAERGETGFERHFEGNEDKRYIWSGNSVRSILRSPIYAGNLVGYKRIAANMKSKKRPSKLPEEWEVIPNTHEGIVTQEEFDIVQQLITSRRLPQNKGGFVNIFAGVIKCVDCGCALRAMNVHRRKRPEIIDCVQYSCNNYARNGRSECSAHNIEARDLFNAVLADINCFADMAVNDEKAVRAIEKRLTETDQSRAKALEKERKKLNKRLAELDRLFSSLYEDKVMERITERNFEMMSGKYQKEQLEIEARLKEVTETLNESYEKSRGIRDFLALIRNYQGLKELDATVINALIDKILVSEREKMADGTVKQEIKIYYKFIGFVDELHIIPTKRWAAMPAKNCTVCGVEYVPGSGASRYCPACAKKIRREKSNESKRRSREQKRIACMNCPQKMTD